jgi:hypothetical protein
VLSSLWRVPSRGGLWARVRAATVRAAVLVTMSGVVTFASHNSNHLALLRQVDDGEYMESLFFGKSMWESFVRRVAKYFIAKECYSSATGVGARDCIFGITCLVWNPGGGIQRCNRLCPS